ncbi:hypothetical protein RCC89_05100 [Cytophagaceae bacterium ABcell3]|nr:hypothetical protein RCC89_05100 [Cytophagaceae bacterium ABcell3]
MASFFSEIFTIKKVAGVEIILSPEGVVYNYVLLEKTGKKIKVLASGKGLSSIKNDIGTDIPVVLVFNGKGILSRSLKGTVEESELVEKIFPGGEEDSFYTSGIYTSKGTFVSITRKDVVDKEINEFIGNGYFVVSVSIGASIGACIGAIIQDNEYMSGTFLFRKGSDDQIEEIVYQVSESESTFQIGDDKVPSTLLPSFAVSFDFLLPITEYLKPQVHQADVLRKEWLEKIKFNFLKLSVLSVFGFFILANLFCFLYFNGENDKLSQENSQLLHDLALFQKLKSSVEEKESFLKKTGWLSQSMSSFYADRIASTVPEKVALLSFTINPVNEELSRKRKSLVFDHNVIIIQGTCESPVILNPWLNKMKSFEWVKNIHTSKYNYDYNAMSGIFELELWVDVEKSDI